MSQHPGPWDPAAVGPFGSPSRPEKELEGVVWADPPGRGCWGDVGGHTLEELHPRASFPGPHWDRPPSSARLSAALPRVTKSRFHGVIAATPFWNTTGSLGKGEVDGVGCPWWSSTPTLQLLRWPSPSWGAPDRANQSRTAPSRTPRPCSCTGVTTQTPSVIPVGCESSRAFHGKRRCQNGEVSAVQCFSGKGKAHRMEGGAWGISGAAG